MLTFAYQAQDALGELIEGTIEVASRDEALAKLKREGLAVVELEEEGGGMELIELAPGVPLAEIRQKTEAEFRVRPGLG